MGQVAGEMIIDWLDHGIRPEDKKKLISNLLKETLQETFHNENFKQNSLIYKGIL